MTVVVPSLVPSVLFTVPYLTIDEYKRAPTGVDIKGLSSTTAQERDAELANVVARASGLVNVICRQNLAATVDTEQGRVRVNRDGEVFIQTACWPVVEVRQVLLGSTPSQLTTPLDLTEIFISDSAFTVLQVSLGLTSSVGPLQLGTLRPSVRAFARWTYVNGWPCTTLTATEIQGETEIDVADATGIHTGTRLTIYDDDKTETVTATAEPTGTTVPVTALAFAHATVGVNVSSLPPAVKEAAILLTSALVKVRGNQALVMKSISDKAPTAQGKGSGYVSDVESAMWMLQPFKAVAR